MNSPRSSNLFKRSWAGRTKTSCRSRSLVKLKKSRNWQGGLKKRRKDINDVCSKVARTSVLEVRGSYLVAASELLYSSAVSRLRRPFLSDRYFFITVRLLKERAKLVDADFHLLALAFNRARVMHPFYLTAWVFLPDHWHGICAPVDPLTISLVMKSAKTSSMILMNRRRAESGELWQACFFDRALRTVREYNEKVRSEEHTSELQSRQYLVC